MKSRRKQPVSPMSQKSSDRLFVAEPLAAGAELRLDEERSRYVGRVLRLRVGDEVILFNGLGGEHIAAITEVARRSIALCIGAHRDRDVESPLEVNLVQGISRGERMDFVVQKATELGAHRITPIMTSHSVVRLPDDKSEKRAAHWTKIVQSACEQCGRNAVPLVDPPQSFERWLQNLTMAGNGRVVLHPGAANTFTSLAPVRERCDLLVGPEGGLSDAELRQATAAGFVPCSIGPRVLRTETAAIAALAILQSRYGDLG
jgi:16S rRNA (uracil1498-N3)-methyltransferase